MFLKITSKIYPKQTVSFQIQTNSLQMFCILNSIFWTYIFGKNVQKRGSFQIEKIIANLYKLTHIYEKTTRNKEFQNKGEGSKAFLTFKKTLLHGSVQ